MENFGLDTKIMGKPMNKFLADVLKKNEDLAIEIERGKLTVSIVKQMNNYSRLGLDAAKYELKKKEFDAKQAQPA